MIFPIGALNDGSLSISSGQSYLAPVSTEQVKIFNVTFEPGCHNNWHNPREPGQRRRTDPYLRGRPGGYYQEWGKEPQELRPGDVVNIAPGEALALRRTSWFSIWR